MIIGYRELRKRSKGFTLIELMIVVAIIAILAAIAIPQYRKFQLKSKTSEAKVNIGAIRTCEEAYAAEHDVYLEMASAPSTVNIASSTRNWNVGGGGDPECINFLDIGFKPAGKVYYNYAVNNQTGNINDATDVPAIAAGTWGTVPVRDMTVDIAIIAHGNLDGDTDDATYAATDENGTIYGPNGDDF
jgi:type IV pilus assembly protein PilA